MRLVEIENQLKKIIEEKGVKDPIVFNKIYELCFEYIRRGHKMNTIDETEDTAMILAETLYMKIYKGEMIHSWLGYINISVIAAIRKYRKMTSSEIWDTANDSNLEESIINMCSSGSMSLNESNYSHIFNEECISKIYVSVEDILDNCCRYYRDTSEWNNIYLFILISLLNGYPVYIFIDEHEIQYARMMLSIVRDKLSQDFKISCDDTRLSGKDLVSLFTLGGVIGD